MPEVPMAEYFRSAETKPPEKRANFRQKASFRLP
jgi:hypothetical protein